MIAETLCLAGDKIQLRPFTSDDAPRIVELLNNWNVASMLARVPFPYREADATTWIDGHNNGRKMGTDWPFAIETKVGLVGTIGIHRTEPNVMEFGYWIGEPHWGKGTATAAGRVLIDFAFDILGVEKLTAGHYTENPASGRILLKTGFEETGESARPCLARGEDMPALDYQLTKARWQAFNQSA
jgi:RimJ/RimL family protein N-acetyltransferase